MEKLLFNIYLSSRLMDHYCTCPGTQLMTGTSHFNASESFSTTTLYARKVIELRTRRECRRFSTISSPKFGPSLNLMQRVFKIGEVAGSTNALWPKKYLCRISSTMFIKKVNSLATEIWPIFCLGMRLIVDFDETEYQIIRKTGFKQFFLNKTWFSWY